MTNTRTVDNLLYTKHLEIKRGPGTENELEQNSSLDSWKSASLKVHELIEKKERDQGKLLWLSKTGRFKGQLWNAFGTDNQSCTEVF